MANIFIVEDDNLSVSYISKLLLAAGHLVSSAGSVTEARDVLAREEAFSLLVLDYHLGTESGLKLLTEIRRSDRYQTLPVIVCSGDTKPIVVKEFLSLGIAGFIAKPFITKRLIREIERVLDLGQHRPAEQAQSPSPIRPAQPSLPP